MPRSRLPSPPSSSKGQKDARPLPPEPAAEAAPPPLPARPPGPGGPSKGRQPPPPSRPQPDDYVEPDSWTDDEEDSDEAPPLPARNFETQEDSDDESEQATYEEPEPVAPVAPPPSTIRKPQPQPVFEESSGGGGGEIYDDLDEVIEGDDFEQDDTYDPPDEEFQQETYDECEIKEAKQQPAAPVMVDVQEELYEVPPNEGEDLIEETEYEFVPEEKTRTPTPPAPPVPQPSLPSRPPPTRKQEPAGENVPDLPTRPAVATPGGGKKQSPASGGMPGIGISAGDISNVLGKLRKVSSEDKKESFESSEGSTGSQVKTDGSFQGKVNLFKQAEAKSPVSAKTFFPKPALPTKPAIIPKASKSNLGAPPPPPTSSVATQPPVKVSSDSSLARPQINGTPSPPPIKRPPPVSGEKKKFEKPDSPPLPPPPEPEENLEEDDIYDEGFTYKPPPDPLAEFEWYHRELDRHKTESKLNAIGQDGAFLVRKSQRGGDVQPFTLVVLYKGHVYNLKIRKRSDTKVALGEEKPDELAFKDVPALISYHRNNDVVLVNLKENKQYKTLLTKFPTFGC